MLIPLSSKIFNIVLTIHGIGNSRSVELMWNWTCVFGIGIGIDQIVFGIGIGIDHFKFTVIGIGIGIDHFKFNVIGIGIGIDQMELTP